MADPGATNTSIETQAELRKFFEIAGTFNLSKWVDWIGDWGISRALFLWLVYIGLFITLGHYVPNLGMYTFQWLVGTAPLWLPIALGIALWKTWKLYVVSLFLSKQKMVLLEMKVPRDITRSPRAMELALTELWVSSGETQFIYRHWRGSLRPYYSLEICSFGGEVHFFVWCREGDKPVIERALYAYYPEIELHEVDDYATKFRFDPRTHGAFGTDHILHPRNDAFPIRTYVDFELDKDPKEEFKVDPLAQVLEFMSSLRPQEQAWVQIMITYNKDKRRKKGSWFATEDRFEGMIKDEVQKIRYESSLAEDEKGKMKVGFPRPTWSQTEAMRAMERHLGKLSFNVGIRAIYWAEKKYMSGPVYNGVRWLWRPLNNPGWLNTLRPKYWHNTLDYPWQDIGNFRNELMTRRFLDAYRRRSYFYPPWTTPSFLMSTEAIATLWHPPSRAVSAPGLDRIPAKKAEPPSNLPR